MGKDLETPLLPHYRASSHPITACEGSSQLIIILTQCETAPDGASSKELLVLRLLFEVVKPGDRLGASTFVKRTFKG